MTYDEQIAVITAKRDGKRVQLQRRDTLEPECWHEMSSNRHFDFERLRYRLAPEPLTVFIPLFTNGCFGYPMESLEALRASLGSVGPGVVDILEFKQVIK